MKPYLRQVTNPDGTLGFVRCSPNDPSNEIQAWIDLVKSIDQDSLNIIKERISNQRKGFDK